MEWCLRVYLQVFVCLSLAWVQVLPACKVTRCQGKVSIDSGCRIGVLCTMFLPSFVEVFSWWSACSICCFVHIFQCLGKDREWGWGSVFCLQRDNCVVCVAVLRHEVTRRSMCEPNPVPNGGLFSLSCGFSDQWSKEGDCLTCSSGSLTKRLLQVAEMDSGRRIHVPVLKCRTFCSIFSLSLWQGGQVRNHPRRLRQYKAFQGIFQSFKRVIVIQKTHDDTQSCKFSCVCVCARLCKPYCRRKFRN